MGRCRVVGTQTTRRMPSERPSGVFCHASCVRDAPQTPASKQHKPPMSSPHSTRRVRFSHGKAPHVANEDEDANASVSHDAEDTGVVKDNNTNVTESVKVVIGNAIAKDHPFMRKSVPQCITTPIRSSLLSESIANSPTTATPSPFNGQAPLGAEDATSLSRQPPNVTSLMFPSIHSGHSIDPDQMWTSTFTEENGQNGPGINVAGYEIVIDSSSDEDDDDEDEDEDNKSNLGNDDNEHKRQHSESRDKTRILVSGSDGIPHCVVTKHGPNNNETVYITGTEINSGDHDGKGRSSSASSKRDKVVIYRKEIVPDNYDETGESGPSNKIVVSGTRIISDDYNDEDDGYNSSDSLLPKTKQSRVVQPRGARVAGAIIRTASLDGEEVNTVAAITANGNQNDPVVTFDTDANDDLALTVNTDAINYAISENNGEPLIFIVVNNKYGFRPFWKGKKNVGVLYLLLSTLIYCFVEIIMKLLTSGTKLVLPVNEIGFIKSVVSNLLVTIEVTWCIYTHQNSQRYKLIDEEADNAIEAEKSKKKDIFDYGGVFGFRSVRLILVLRCVLGYASVIFSWYSLTLLSLGEYTVLRFLSPVFTTLLAYFFIGETFGFAEIFTGAMSIVGTILISCPNQVNMVARAIYEYFRRQISPDSIVLALVDTENFLQDMSGHTAGVFYVVTAAILSSIVTLILRSIADRTSHLHSVIYYSIVSFPLSLGLGIICDENWTIPTHPATYIFLIAASVLSFVAHLLAAKGIQLVTATHASSLSYIQVVFAFIGEWLVWGKLPTIHTLLGAAIICGAMLCGTFVAQKNRNIAKMTAESALDIEATRIAPEQI